MSICSVTEVQFGCSGVSHSKVYTAKFTAALPNLPVRWSASLENLKGSLPKCQAKGRHTLFIDHFRWRTFIEEFTLKIFRPNTLVVRNLHWRIFNEDSFVRTLSPEHSLSAFRGCLPFPACIPRIWRNFNLKSFRSWPRGRLIPNFIHIFSIAASMNCRWRRWTQCSALILDR